VIAQLWHRCCMRLGIGMEALLSENDRLRRELEELRRSKDPSNASRNVQPLNSITAGDGSQQRRGNDDGGGSSSSTQQVQLQRRGYGRSFSIRSWTGERNEQQELGKAGALALPHSEVSTQSVVVGDSMAKPAQEHIEANAMAKLPAWLPQRWDGSCEIHRLLMEVTSEVKAADGLNDAAHTLFGQAFTHHLSQKDRAHLGFSATLPLFFAALQHGRGGVSVNESSPHGGRGRLVVRSGGAHCLDAIGCCTALLQRLQAAARFGDKPPDNRPQGVGRWDYVRDLCAQAGASLDMARLTYVKHRHGQRQGVAKDSSRSSTAAAIADEQETKELARKLHQLQAGPCAVSKEFDAALCRAGAYLRAVQIDMERWRDEADRLASKVALRPSSGLATQRATPKNDTLAPLDQLTDETTGDVCSEHEGNVLLPIADSDTSQAMTPADGNAVESSGGDYTAGKQSLEAQVLSEVEEEELPAGINSEGVVDELIVPTFGQFLERQLMPLYIRDIPFRFLRDLLEHYCGVPVDSDDEVQARKVLGCEERAHKARTKGQAARKSGTEARARSDDLDSQPATPSSQGSAPTRLASRASRIDEDDQTLGQLIQVAERKPAMRVQMANSVIEKRRTGKPAHPDVKPRFASALALRTAGGKRVNVEGSKKSSQANSRAMLPPPTPKQQSVKRGHVAATPVVSKALVVSPASEASAAKKRGKRMQVSPVQWRRHVRTEDTRPAPSPFNPSSSANFSLLDDDETPWKKKKDGKSSFEG